VELVQGLHNIRDRHKACVLTIGKFDGVHLGHQAVLKNLVKKARKMQLPATVMIFEPQPEELFQPESAPARLSSLRDKYQQLKQLGVDRLLCVRFNQRFASLSARAFIEELLVDKLGVRFLVVGDDFRFGQKRVGDFSMLQQEGLKHAFEVVSTQSFRLLDSRISSSAIREALADSDFKHARAMLGRAFSFHGRVIHGDKKGRTIGFPTANLLLKGANSPLNGVFAVKVNIQGQQHLGVANIGRRPTVNGQRRQLEVNIFDYAADLYGAHIHVEPVAKLREEKKFSSFNELQQQIKLDASQAKQVLAEQN